MTRTAPAALAVLLVVLVAGAACRSRSDAPASAPVTAAVIEAPQVTSGRILARASSRAIATSADRVLFGDEAAGALLAVSKRGGEPVVIGERTPLDIALPGEDVAWIAAPGELLLRARARGGLEGVRSSGRFTALASHRGEVYATEIALDGGAVVRVDGRRAFTLASFPARARELVVDDQDVFVMTDSEIHRVPRDGGPVTVAATGNALSGLALAGDLLFATSALPTGRGLLRVPRDRAQHAEIIARDVRNGPIAVWNRQAYFFEAGAPVLRRISVDGGEDVAVARAPELAWVAALAVDASGIYLAVDYQKDGAIVAIPRGPSGP